jgi:hypothetical protein
MPQIGFLASPRRRRRLAWVGGIGVVVGVGAVIVALAPSHGSTPNAGHAPRAPIFGTTTSPAPFSTTVSAVEERARAHAEAAVRPLAETFITAMAQRTNLRKAHALLALDFQSGSVSDWEDGRDLPVNLPTDSSFGGTTVAYSDAHEVGVVVSVNEPRRLENGLVAVRFEKSAASWKIDYVHHGHSSTYVGVTNYSPAGFLPGSHHETKWTWLILGFGLIGIVAVVALLDWVLSRTRRHRPHSAA